MLTIFDVEKLRCILGNIMALKTIDDIEDELLRLDEFRR